MPIKIQSDLPVKEILEKAGDDEEELKAELRRNIHELVPKCITKEISLLPSTTICTLSTASA